MTYYTISSDNKLIDSISSNYEILKNRFPDEKIYKSDKPIVSIYVIKDQLYEV